MAHRPPGAQPPRVRDRAAPMPGDAPRPPRAAGRAGRDPHAVAESAARAGCAAAPDPRLRVPGAGLDPGRLRPELTRSRRYCTGSGWPQSMKYVSWPFTRARWMLRSPFLPLIVARTWTGRASAMVADWVSVAYSNVSGLPTFLTLSFRVASC